MATYKAPKPITKRAEVRKDTVTSTFIRLQDFFVDYRRYITYSGIGIVVLVIAIVSYRYIREGRSQQADELLGGILLYYESGEYRTALDGTDADPGLIEIANQFGNTDPGNLARLYAGDAAFRLNEHDQALEMFEAYRGRGDMLAASALDGRAAVHELRGNYEEAATFYERAANVNKNVLRSPEYLKKAARAYGKAGDYEKAEETLLKIGEEYPDSEVAQELDFHLGFVRARMR